MTEPNRRGPDKRFVAITLTLCVGLVVAVIMIAGYVITKDKPGPVRLSPIDAPEAESTTCAQFGRALPRTLGDFAIVEIAPPIPAATAAYRSPQSPDPVIVRCGLVRSDPNDQAFQPVQVNSVLWAKVGTPGTEANSTTWLTQSRVVVVGVTLPANSGASPIEQLSAVVASSVPNL